MGEAVRKAWRPTQISNNKEGEWKLCASLKVNGAPLATQMHHLYETEMIPFLPLNYIECFLLATQHVL